MLLIMLTKSDDVVDNVLEEEEEDIIDPHPNPRSIKTSTFKSIAPLKDVMWCGPNSEIMLVHTISGYVYRSQDDGDTWEYKHSDKSHMQENKIPSPHKIIILLPSPADLNIVFFIGYKGMNWVSEDCGATIKPLNGEKKITNFKFHPTQREWALASIYSACDEFEDDECNSVEELYLTTDLGKSWRKLQDRIIQYEWGMQTVDDPETHEKQIIAVKASKNSDVDNLVWNSMNKIIVSNDFFKSSSVLLKGGNYFKLTKDYLYAGKVTKKGKKVLTRSVKKYGYSTFYDMKISAKNVHQFDFSVIESITGAVFLFVTRPGKKLHSGNVYLSDAKGTGFSLNLEKVPFQSSYEFDFLEMESLEGVIIANSYDNNLKDSLVESQTGKKSKTVNRDINSGMKRKSYITFNRGGKWQSLTPPQYSSTGKRIICRLDDGCSLHLHSLTSSKYPYPYSLSNAAGIIVGIGNVGKYLKYEDKKLNTYISRDGGLTWIEVIKGPHIVEFGDHGGLILLAPLYKLTDYILYTWNYGETWEAIKLPNKMQVDNIVIEPTSTSSKFIVFGEPNDEGIGIIVSMDFNELHENQCKGEQTPDQEGSDYEYWSPNDGRHGTPCFLGRKISYVRRKKNSPCFNGQDYETQQFIENCECTRLDFECDNGFKSLPNKEQCVPINNHTVEPTIPEDCENFYTITTGYRKIPGDTCEGGETYSPTRVMCPKKWGFFSVRSLMIQLSLLVGGYFFAKYLNEHGFPTMEDITSLVKRKPIKEDREEFDYNIGYQNSDSEEETKNEPQLHLEQEDEEYPEYLGLNRRKYD
ncbi:unnamed protein product [Moneuplotes crassus]|uniref:VPS10 domain-containing protein n=1 Tax=Euplotes crassus TaxID=5936 RepID=A0AAD1Y664_EUPCR|nr:unnamed protein product [Moneuplotes crassus]